jgi:glucose/arabinose dehydrogenase
MLWFMRARLIVLVLACLVTACSSDKPATPSPSASAPAPTLTALASPSTTVPPTTAPPTTAPPVTEHVIADGLEVPWGLAFLPDGSALVAERAKGRIQRVTAGGSHQVVATVPGVVPQGEGGLLGLAVSPTYRQDQWVYAYYTSQLDNRVVRFRLDAPQKQFVVISRIHSAGNHNGGRLAFGPDGMLYASTGDAGEPSRAQSKDSLNGKVLRLRPSGGAAPGNPFGNAVWSMGHRNVQGLAFDPQGRLWASEFGQNTWDEVNLIERGKNYGWPVVEGNGTGGGRYVSPKVVWPTSESSPSGLAYGDGALYAGALRGMRLWQIPLTGTETGTPEARYGEKYGRIRTVVLEPAGRALWITTSNCDGRGDCGARKDLIVRVPLR